MSENVYLSLIASYPAIVAVSLVFIAIEHGQLPKQSRDTLPIPIDYVYIGIPVLFGLIFPVFYALVVQLPIPRKVSGVYLHFNIAGGLTAALISMLLDAGLNFYSKYLDVNVDMYYHAYVFAAYFIVFQVAGIRLYKNVAGYFADRYSSSSSSKPKSSGTSTSTSPNILSKLTARGTA